MTERQRRFVEEYMVDGIGKYAAIRAGYSAMTADEQASQLLNHPSVKAAIDAKKAEQAERLGISAERVLKEYAKLAYVNTQDIAMLNSAEILDQAKRHDTAAIQSIRVKRNGKGQITEREVKLYDKTKALDALANHLGLTKDTLKIEDLNITIKEIAD